MSKKNISLHKQFLHTFWDSIGRKEPMRPNKKSKKLLHIIQKNVTLLFCKLFEKIIYLPVN